MLTSWALMACQSQWLDPSSTGALAATWRRDCFAGNGVLCVAVAVPCLLGPVGGHLAPGQELCYGRVWAVG